MGASPYVLRLLVGHGEDSMLRRGDLEMIARRAFERAELDEDYPDPAEVAVSLGYRVFRMRVGGNCVPEFCAAGQIYYVPHADQRETAARIAHGLAHCLLADDGVDHGEPDVWRLTAELLAPYWLVRRQSRVEALRKAVFCPEWILATRPTLEAAG